MSEAGTASRDPWGDTRSALALLYWSGFVWLCVEVASDALIALAGGTGGVRMIRNVAGLGFVFFAAQACVLLARVGVDRARAASIGAAVSWAVALAAGAVVAWFNVVDRGRSGSMDLATVENFAIGTEVARFFGLLLATIGIVRTLRALGASVPAFFGVGSVVLFVLASVLPYVLPYVGVDRYFEPGTSFIVATGAEVLWGTAWLIFLTQARRRLIVANPAGLPRSGSP